MSLILFRQLNRHQRNDSQLPHLHAGLQETNEAHYTLKMYPVFPGRKSLPICSTIRVPSTFFLADYDSEYPILRKLNSATSALTINHLKSIFAEHGTPETFISDIGPHYSSREFAFFCDQWGINHVSSTPRYPESNGFKERIVQIVKNLLRKADASGQNPHLALLSYRTTPATYRQQHNYEITN